MFTSDRTIRSDWQAVECGKSLSSIPAEIVSQDLKAITASDEWPDLHGNCYEIAHRRELNWKIQHDCSVVVSMRHVDSSSSNTTSTTDLVEGFRLVVLHPTDKQRAIAVVENSATSKKEALTVLKRAATWALENHLHAHSRIYTVLSTEPAQLEALIMHVVPASMSDNQPVLTPAERIKVSRRFMQSLSKQERLAQERTLMRNAPEAAEPEEREEMECSVCMCEIANTDVAMRCRQSLHPHYFHAQCLEQWAAACRGNWSEATCPVCRGPIEINKERLIYWLSGKESKALDNKTRGLLEGMADSLSDGWNGLSRRQVAEGVGAIAGLGYGFYSGYQCRAPRLMTGGLVWDNAPTSVQLAVAGGWIGGVGVRILKTVVARR